jgi:hypothetical protein
LGVLVKLIFLCLIGSLSLIRVTLLFAVYFDARMASLQAYVGYRRVEALADTPKGQLLAIYDALEEWFALPEFRGCMFIKAGAEFQELDHPIHVKSAEHIYLVCRFGLKEPEQCSTSSRHLHDCWTSSGRRMLATKITLGIRAAANFKAN